MAHDRGPRLCFCDLDDRNHLQAIDALGVLPRVEDAAACPPETTHVLWHDASGLALGPVELPRSRATRVDFDDPALLYRLKTSGRRQGVGKAVGLDKTHDTIEVLDATAGLGRDALVMAHLGCRVTMVERSPWIHALLADGLRRGRISEHDMVRQAVGRMTLVPGDARGQLDGMLEAGSQPDVVYLDPMFPPRRKSAAVKKDIGVLQEVLGPDTDLEELLAMALRCARRRVVVKRPPDQPDIPGPPPSFTLEGKATFFAVYVNSSFSSKR